MICCNGIVLCYIVFLARPHIMIFNVTCCVVAKNAHGLCFTLTVVMYVGKIKYYIEKRKQLCMHDVWVPSSWHTHVLPPVE